MLFHFNEVLKHYSYLFKGTTKTGFNFIVFVVGDIIIEANGRPVHSPNDIKMLLPINSRVVPLSYIPVGKPQTVKNTDKLVNGKPSTEGSRVKRAKDLHDMVGSMPTQTGVCYVLNDA